MNFIHPLAGLGIATLISIIIGISLLPKIFFLLTLQRTFDEISPENSLLPSAQVWLALIPFFGLIWQFVIVIKMADSLQMEFKKKNIEIKELRPGYNIGLVYCILYACTIIPFFGFLTGFAGFICWIIYWVNINDYRNMLVRLKLTNRGDGHQYTN